MKKQIAILAAIIAFLTLTACDVAHDTEKAPQEAEARLIVVDESMSYRIYIDRETKVMYLRTKQGYGEAVCVMVDADGNPLLWKGEEHE